MSSEINKGLYVCKYLLDFIGFNSEEATMAWILQKQNER